MAIFRFHDGHLIASSPYKTGSTYAGFYVFAQNQASIGELVKPEVHALGLYCILFGISIFRREKNEQLSRFGGLFSSE